MEQHVSGTKRDTGKPDFTLLPFSALVPVVRVLEHGAKKYGRKNWQHVYDAKRRYTAAALRHLTAYSDGEKVDEEGQPHLACAVCSLLFLIFFDNAHDDTEAQAAKADEARGVHDLPEV